MERKLVFTTGNFCEILGARRIVFYCLALAAEKEDEEVASFFKKGALIDIDGPVFTFTEGIWFLSKLVGKKINLFFFN